MARFRKPFFRAPRGLWYVQLDGKQINLGPDREEAFRRYGELMARPRPAKLASDSIAVLMDLFLDWCEKHREARTYDWYKDRCQGFLDVIPARLPVRELKPFHVQRWVDSHEWNDGMKRGSARERRKTATRLSRRARDTSRREKAKRVRPRRQRFESAGLPLFQECEEKAALLSTPRKLRTRTCAPHRR